MQRFTSQTLVAATVAATLMACAGGGAFAQSAHRDSIGSLIERERALDSGPERTLDPRAGDKSYEQAKHLMSAIDALLKDTAKNRSDARKLPSKDEFIVPPIWTETRQDRERRVRDLLDAVLAIVTDVPIVEMQKRIEQARKNIAQLEDTIAAAKEKQLTAPKNVPVYDIVSDTVDSLAASIADSRARIAKNKDVIKSTKAEVAAALKKSGISLTASQTDLLLDGVLSGDIVRLVAVFNSAKMIDSQLAKLMAATGSNMKSARKYFAMHAALFAMLVHAQDSLITKIDTIYMPKLDVIRKDIAHAASRTKKLLRAENRPDQRRALVANRDSQKLAEEAARGYRRYLMQQREQIAAARRRAVHDLMIADNTFETVEASYQLRNLMRNSTASFEALQKLQAPTFEQIFKNEELRREFESITKKLEVPSS